MKLAKISVNGVNIQARILAPVPKGIVGATIELEFSGDVWAGLNKTVVFRGSTTKDVLDVGDVVTIPAEVVAATGHRLRVGVYGTDAENNIVIPTLWCDLGRIMDAADPSGDPSTDPGLPVWAQLESRVKKLEQSGGGSIPEESIEQAVRDYLEENPSAQFETDPETLVLEDGVLAVKTTTEVAEDDSRPITSGAVYNEFSKAVALLKTI